MGHHGKKFMHILARVAVWLVLTTAIASATCEAIRPSVKSIRRTVDEANRLLKGLVKLVGLLSALVAAVGTLARFFAG